MYNHLRASSTSARYRFLESIPGIVTWTLIAVALALAYASPVVFVIVALTFTLYWTINCWRTMILAAKGVGRVLKTGATDWTARLEAEYPEWKDYYYCAIVPFASESINVLRPTIRSIAEGQGLAERRILCLGSEKALPGGKAIAERLAAEFQGSFAHIFITEHALRPGEIKGKASNENHCGRFLYDRILELGIDPAKVLLTSNDADVLNEPCYQPYLLHTFLSAGPDRDRYIYQPIPTDYNNFWSAQCFSRVIISAGVLWRIALQMRGNYRCTVYSFYSMTLETLKDIGFWDTDLIPEDERTMFRALEAFGSRFRVVPLFVLTRGSPVSGANAWEALREQYVQMRRWAWGASEFAHSMSVYLEAPAGLRKALRLPILNQLRNSTEWSLSSLTLMFAAYLPSMFNRQFGLTPLGQAYPAVVSGLMTLVSCLILAIIAMERRLAPLRPAHLGKRFTVMTYAQWLLAPVIGIALGSVPALDSQTRLIINRRIAYIESRKEPGELKAEPIMAAGLYKA